MKTGILLSNIGTPDAPTPTAVRRYLQEFLTDQRVVELPRCIWWPILYGYILRVRPSQSAQLYQKIWLEQGSPLLYYSQELASQLQQKLQLPVVLGMRYGQPSIKSGLEKLRAQQVERILVLPLFPQYSNTTTASAFAAVNAVLETWSELPQLVFINHYAQNSFYLQALCQSIQLSPDEHLLFSFHGIPERYAAKGDPYPRHCYETAAKVANLLNLENNRWSVAFQSRLGRAKWLAPYTDDVLKSLPQRGIKQLKVICPGFAVDCLETLEEIALRGQEQFMHAGGEKFTYIPALNAEAIHVNVLQTILNPCVDVSVPLVGWHPVSTKAALDA